MNLKRFDELPKAFDGERLRDLWKPGDGPGDGDVDLVSDGYTRQGGHPTWKIFASDLPEGVQRTGHNPPIRVYLDDKTCYEVVTSGEFSGNLMGRSWPYDFTATGTVRVNRPNRGRPALLENGEVATIRKFRGIYRFSGATDDVVENDGVDTIHPNAMALSGTHTELKTENVETLNPRAAKRQKIDYGLLTKPIDELDEEDLDEMRSKYSKAMDDAHKAHVRAAELHDQFTRAERERAALSKEHERVQKKLQQTMSRLETQHRDNKELEMSLKKNNMDSMITRRMLEKTKKELRELKNAHALLQVSAEEANVGNSGQSTDTQELLAEFCKTLFVGHLSSKAICRAGEHDGGDPAVGMKLLKDTQEVIDAGIDAIRVEMLSKGLETVFENVMSAGQDAGGQECDDASDAHSA